MELTNDRFLKNCFFVGLFTLRAFARNLLRGSRRKNIFSYFVFDDWPEIRTQAFESNKPTQYLLDHGDYIALEPLKQKITIVGTVLFMQQHKNYVSFQYTQVNFFS